MLKNFLTIFFVFPCIAGTCQHAATVREYDKEMLTYPFSLPDPIAAKTTLYPYFRFDGYTNEPVMKKWKIVELENDFIKVLITPQIGGKIWTAIDKINGKPFIYQNDVVKFRDVAMRGPWTSGGIEMNFGIYGHTGGVATPVNYLTSVNTDGSAQCVLSLTDLISDTRWSMTVLLRKDKAYFETHIVWHNPTPVGRPYYSWTNIAEKVSDSLVYIFPGTHYLYHDGKVYDWPVDPDNKKRISIYNQNDFGSSKSYHVIGTYTNYFGTFWQKENFGAIHYTTTEEKPGKKIWIWGLSREGMIWEHLLSDHAGQYTEIQSGRLFNQNAPQSVETPFKQFYFEPYGTDTWAEYYYPFENTGGVLNADLTGVINLNRQKDRILLSFSPLVYLRDTLKVYDKMNRIVFEKKLELRPLQSVQEPLPSVAYGDIGAIAVGTSVYHLKDSSDKVLARPLNTDPKFSLQSAYGLYLSGKYKAATRHLIEAENDIRLSLQKDSFFVPALTEMSYLQYQKMNYDSAFYYASRALMIDTYDPASNYYYALAAEHVGKWFDALDGFNVAALSPIMRAAAYTELSKMHLQKGSYDKAFSFAQSALEFNAGNITALQVQYAAARLLKQEDQKRSINKKILSLDPLNAFLRFENYLQDPSTANKNKFIGLVREELPAQAYLQLADFYTACGLFKEAEALLETAPVKDNEMQYWLAYLHRNEGTEKYLKEAKVGSPLFVFPFRHQSAAVMEWATEKTNDWKAVYYLALTYRSNSQPARALSLLESLADTISFAPLYALRSGLYKSSDSLKALHDLEKASSLTEDWRYKKLLAEFLLAHQQNQRALELARPLYQGDKKNYILGLLYAQCLIVNDRNEEAEKLLEGLEVLPYEGSGAGHILYERNKLLLALASYSRGEVEKALQKAGEARLWPEHLGAGQPYSDMLQEDLINETVALIKKKASQSETRILTEKLKQMQLGR